LASIPFDFQRSSAPRGFSTGRLVLSDAVAIECVDLAERSNRHNLAGAIFGISIHFFGGDGKSPLPQRIKSFAAVGKSMRPGPSKALNSQFRRKSGRNDLLLPPTRAFMDV
jgi:hypothetical protein